MPTTGPEHWLVSEQWLCGLYLTSMQRKETLGVLMRATRSASSALKSLAAENIQYFLQDFPDLEEQAINAVYDLCEDQDQQVRNPLVALRFKNAHITADTDTRLQGNKSNIQN